VITITQFKFKTMSGRGDNNKHGSAGRGASNQSNEPLAGDKKHKKSNHNKHAEGGKASVPQPKQQSQSKQEHQCK
jgi:hypothetical protein